jgi:hypothetical protein
MSECRETAVAYRMLYRKTVRRAQECSDRTSEGSPAKGAVSAAVE